MKTSDRQDYCLNFKYKHRPTQKHQRIFVLIPTVLVLIAVSSIFIWKSKQQAAPAEFGKFEFFKQERAPAQLINKKTRQSTVLYKLKANATATEKGNLKKVSESLGLKTHKKIVDGKIDFAKIDDLSISEEQLVSAIVETGAVEFAETDDLMEMAYIPNDPNLISQGTIRKLDLTQLGTQQWD